MEQNKILIVGAGPTGLVLANALAKYHVPFRIIDEKLEPSSKSKAIAIFRRSLNMLNRLDIADTFIQQGLTLKDIKFYARRKKLAHIHIPQPQNNTPYGISLPQCQSELILIEKLLEMGREVEWNTSLTSLTQDDGKIEVVINNETLTHYKYVVGCDGAHSTVRHSLNIPFDGGIYPQHFLLGDVAVRWGTFRPADIMLFLSRATPAFMIALPDGHYRMIAALKDEVVPSLENLQKIAEKNIYKNIQLNKPNWVTNFTIHHRIASKFSKGNVFLCGDAAHIHSPAGGQGMNTGMQDAFNLAWKLAYSINRDGGPLLLSSYNKERFDIAKKVIEISDRATKIATSNNYALHFVRKHFLRFAFKTKRMRDLLVKNLAGEYVGYNSGHDDYDTFSLATPGKYCPDGKIKYLSQTHQLVRFIARYEKYILLVFNSQKEHFNEMNKFILENYPDSIQVFWVSRHSLESDIHGISDFQGDLCKAFGTVTDCAYLLRPDGYIAYRQRPVLVSKLKFFLSKNLKAKGN